MSTGGQAGFALDKLTELMAEEFPEAYKPLRENRYVDDLLFGDDSVSGRDDQIITVEEVLKRGGFTLNFVVKSGGKPWVLGHFPSTTSPTQFPQSQLPQQQFPQPLISPTLTSPVTNFPNSNFPNSNFPMQ